MNEGSEFRLKQRSAVRYARRYGLCVYMSRPRNDPLELDPDEALEEIRKGSTVWLDVARPRIADVHGLAIEEFLAPSELSVLPSPLDFGDCSAPTVRRMTHEEQSAWARREPLTRPYVK